MIEELLGLPAHMRARLARVLESGTLELPCSGAAVRHALNVGREEADRLRGQLEMLSSGGISGRQIGAWLRGHEAGVSSAVRPDLVWSGPEVPGVHARDTRRVYEQLLGGARRSAWVSTYAFYDGPRAFDVLAKRMDEQPELRATLLLNIKRKRGDKRDAQTLVRTFAERFWRRDWPGTRRPSVYYDPRSLELGGASGVLHAKGAVVDDEAVFITSANFTARALDSNYELGLLVRDPALAATVTSHFRILIERKLLRPLPLA